MRKGCKGRKCREESAGHFDNSLDMVHKESPFEGHKRASGAEQNRLDRVLVAQRRKPAASEHTGILRLKK